MKARDFAKGMKDYAAFVHNRPQIKFKNGSAQVEDDGSFYLSCSHLTATEAVELGEWLLRLFGKTSDGG